MIPALINSFLRINSSDKQPLPEQRKNEYFPLIHKLRKYNINLNKKDTTSNQALQNIIKQNLTLKTEVPPLHQDHHLKPHPIPKEQKPENPLPENSKAVIINSIDTHVAETEQAKAEDMKEQPQTIVTHDDPLHLKPIEKTPLVAPTKLPPQGTTKTLANNAALFDAVHNSNHAKLKKLLAEGADPNATDEHGQTLLHIAAEHNDLRSSYILHRANANPLIKNAKQQTPLNIAQWLQHKNNFQGSIWRHTYRFYSKAEEVYKQKHYE